MKRIVTLLMALVFVLALFAGCSGGTPTGTPDNGSATSAPATSAPTSAPASAKPTEAPVATAAPEETPAPTEEPSPYKFASGKFAADENGVALEPFSYEQPFCTTDEVIQYWNVCYTPQFLPEEGMNSMPYQMDVEKMTGVHVEYLCPAAETKQQAFSVLLASDDLPDLMAHGLTYYGRSANDAIDEGWFANIYDYREYAPNYFYQADQFTEKVHNTIYTRPDRVAWFYGILVNPTPANGTVIRTDFLDRVGMKWEDITTFDKMHDALYAFKTQLEVQWPMELYYTLEQGPGVTFSGFNTAVWVNPYGLPSVRRVDDEVMFTLTREDDKDAITMLQQWYQEGLIDPGWPGYTSNDQMSDMITTDKCGLANMNASQIPDYEGQSVNPDCKWVSLPRTLRYDGQELKYAQELNHMTYGYVTLSAKCANLPLAVTWCDWFFSPEGAEYSSWGPEGIVWEYNAKGERQLTDFVLNNPAGATSAWVLLLYSANNLCDATLFDQTRSYAYEGGEEVFEMSKRWLVPNYKGEYDMPSGFKLTDEESEEIRQYSGDLVTYLNETYLAFFTGDRPMSEWDTYQQGLITCGMDKILEIYQNAYDAYMAENA